MTTRRKVEQLSIPFEPRPRQVEFLPFSNPSAIHAAIEQVQRIMREHLARDMRLMLIGTPITAQSQWERQRLNEADAAAWREFMVRL